MIANVTVFADDRAGNDVRERPNAGSCADFDVLIN